MFQLVLLTCVFTCVSAFSTPHLDLEMTSAEYRTYLKSTTSVKQDDPAIREGLRIGDRLSRWIGAINASRPAGPAIRLTAPNVQGGIPIDRPLVYSPATIQAEINAAMAGLPASMKEVINSAGPFPFNPGVDDETFIQFARPLDRVYQRSARYKAVDQFRDHYIGQAIRDVRGLYFLEKNKIRAANLRNVGAINPTLLRSISEALFLICLNNKSETQTSCQFKLRQALSTNALSEYYSAYINGSTQNWYSFFRIPKQVLRTDLHATPRLLDVPFNNPSIPKFAPFLRYNIEDEYRWGNWQLKLYFGTYLNGPRLEFKPGATPHVDRLGGNLITMDANSPIEEFSSQWLIRHEFGHVLGLPDCYHEFYDVNLKAYVNYQLDLSDLMCSRAGKMNERIYLELKENYN